MDELGAIFAMPAAVPGVMVDSMSVGVNATQILILRVQPVGRARDGGGSSSADPSGCRFFIALIKSFSISFVLPRFECEQCTNTVFVNIYKC